MYTVFVCSQPFYCLLTFKPKHLQHRGSQKDRIRVRIRNLYFLFIIIWCSFPVKPRHLVDIRAVALLFCPMSLASQKQGCTHIRCENVTQLCKTTYCRVVQRRVRSAWAAEESTLGHQILVCIYRVHQVLPADQSTEQLFVCRTWQVHAVITLKYRVRFMFSLCLKRALSEKKKKKSYLYDKIAWRISSHLCKLSY